MGTIAHPHCSVNSQVVLYTCPPLPAGVTCPLQSGRQAVIMTNTSSSQTATFTTATFDSASNTWTVGGTASAVVIGTNGQPAAVAPSTGGGGSSGGGGMMIIIIIVIAVVVVLVVVGVVVMKKGSGGGGAAPAGRSNFGGVGFENPLCKFHCVPNC